RAVEAPCRVQKRPHQLGADHFEPLLRGLRARGDRGHVDPDGPVGGASRGGHGGQHGLPDGSAAVVRGLGLEAQEAEVLRGVLVPDDLHGVAVVQHVVPGAAQVRAPAVGLVREPGRERVETQSDDVARRRDGEDGAVDERQAAISSRRSSDGPAGGRTRSLRGSGRAMPPRARERRGKAGARIPTPLWPTRVGCATDWGQLCTTRDRARRGGGSGTGGIRQYGAEIRVVGPEWMRNRTLRSSSVTDMSKRPFWLAGSATTGDSELTVTNPYTGRTVATVAVPTPEQIEQAVAAAHGVLDETAALPAHVRSEALAHVARRL